MTLHCKLLKFELTYPKDTFKPKKLRKSKRKAINTKNLGVYLPFFYPTLHQIGHNYKYLTRLLGAVLNIYSYDQFGVELGKKMANKHLSS